ncbi:MULTISPECIES: YihY/virulence factor BrkB family protein [unclassified Nocardioides]|uniref:YihY/virulence factor BrkB family protein n=1 Tax=unclassified Nocardioides TaxID=2615069 RepID=UPI0009EA6084|nr:MULTISPECIES: YihY/virulence factor BrkB family protein [unclassified Nocardioides]
MSLADRLKQQVSRLRARSTVVDHAVRTQEHFSEVKGGQQAGGVTYFGFLSVFPVLALAFFAIGYVANVFPDAQDALLDAIDEVLPGLVGGGPNEVPLEDVQDAAGAVGLIGLAGVLYAGLGWLSSLQTALIVLFEMPERLQPSFVIGKLRDLLTLVVLGAVLLLSVAVSGVLTRMSEQVLDLVDLGHGLGWLVTLLALVVGLATSALLFFLIFRLLARPPVPDRALWSGAWLGAIGFEVLKQLSGLLLVGTRGQPAFQAFGIALILLVWINYFSRVILYAAAWAHTSAAAREDRDARRAALLPVAVATVTRPEQDADTGRGWGPPLAVGGALGLLLGARLGRRRQDRGPLGG